MSLVPGNGANDKSSDESWLEQEMVLPGRTVQTSKRADVCPDAQASAAL